VGINLREARPERKKFEASLLAVEEVMLAGFVGILRLSHGSKAKQSCSREWVWNTKGATSEK
jgi:hypothetical protein